MTELARYLVRKVRRLDGLGQACPSPGQVGRRPTGDRAHRRTGTRNQRQTDQKIMSGGSRSALTQPMGRFAESPGPRFNGVMPEVTAPTRQQKITLGEMRSSGVR